MSLCVIVVLGHGKNNSGDACMQLSLIALFAKEFSGFK